MNIFIQFPFSTNKEEVIFISIAYEMNVGILKMNESME